MTLGEFLDVIFGDLGQRQVQLVGTGGNVPEDIAEFVLELGAYLFVHHAAVITLDLFNDVRHLAGLAGKTERRVLDILKPSADKELSCRRPIDILRSSYIYLVTVFVASSRQ